MGAVWRLESLQLDKDEDFGSASTKYQAFCLSFKAETEEQTRSRTEISLITGRSLCGWDASAVGPVAFINSSDG